MREHMQMKKSLLDEDGDLGEFGIRVNKEYAARFEHNKQREELHRLQARYPAEAEKLSRKIARDAARASGKAVPTDAEDEDSSDDEEEDEGEIPEDTEAKIFDTLLRIRNQDPSIYKKDVTFFDEAGEDADDDGQAEGRSRKKAKSMYLKDMIAKQALEHGPGGDSSDEEGPGTGREERHPKAYDPEQEDLRKAFLTAVEDADEPEALGGVLRLRSKGQEPSSDIDDVQEGGSGGAGGKKGKAAGKTGGKKNAGQFQQLIEAYFGSEGELNPEDKFLKEYIMNKGWVDREDDYVPSYREIVGDDDDGTAAAGSEGVNVDEDEEYLREVDAFEAKYNFRFEEPGADRIVTHPRIIEGTVRKPDDKRKRQRDAKKQRQAEEEEATRADVKRLKNLKKQEIESKLDKLREVAGTAAPAAASLDDMLEGDFDPEEWDKKMAAAFDDAYYEAEDDLEHLQADLDLLGGDMDDDDEDDEGDDGAGPNQPLRFKTLKKKLKEVDALSEDPEAGEEAANHVADPEVAARQRAEMQRLLEEYYKLDYEDNVGGIKTRFRYKEVPASTFGLSLDDILRLDEKSLNQVVGIKRLAPYREDLAKQRPNYKALEMIKGEKLQSQKRTNKRRDLQKAFASGQHGGQWWREKGGTSGAAGVGPGSTRAAGRDAAPRQSVKHNQAADRAEQQANAAGPGPGSQAGRGKEAGRTKALQGGRGGHAPSKPNKPQQKELDPHQARMASYAVPTLKKDSYGGHGGQALGGKKRKRGEGDAAGAAPAAQQEGSQLTRAQRKNLKRSQKRATKRGSE